MPLNRLSDAELRAVCRTTIESLEIWLRRVIDLALRGELGEDYINALNTNTRKHIFKKSLRESIEKRTNQHPRRYSRPIDAALLEDVIYIVCHDNLYDRFFKSFFELHYPQGRYELRTFLNRLLVPRNALAHSNPVSVRQAEQVICYSNDAIDAIKHRLEELNMASDYNAPIIIRITDSRRFVFHDAQIRRNSTGRGLVSLAEDSAAWLRVGDTLGLEVEVDPSFSPDDYRIEWVVPKEEHSLPASSRLVLDICEDHINFVLTIYCKIISNKSWHRCGDVDDAVGVSYRVLPRDPGASLSA